MNLLEQAYKELYPESTTTRQFSIEYNGRFRGYNANIRMTPTTITLSASKNWKTISPDIQKGLFQELLSRLFKTKKSTINKDLYHNFIKSMSTYAPKTQTDPILENSFKKVNEMFFNGMMATPNLRYGDGINRLGTYEYATDTITISKILLENETLLDYVMYHEMLHKKHQYSTKKGHTRHHSTQFREDEAKFPNAQQLEIELNKLVRKNKRTFKWW